MLVDTNVTIFLCIQIEQCLLQPIDKSRSLDVIDLSMTSVWLSKFDFRTFSFALYKPNTDVSA